MKPFTFDMTYREPLEIFSALHEMPYSIFLDSADRAHKDAHYSFIAFHPLETIEVKDGRVTITNRNQQTSIESDPFEILRGRLRAWGMDAAPLSDAPPFQGGAAGFFGYDMGRGLEALPVLAAEDKDMPDMAAGIYDRVVSFDHVQKKCRIIIHAADENEARAKYAHALKILENPFSLNENPEIAWAPLLSRAEYTAQIRKVIDYIHAGDIFQANLAQCFEADLPQDFDTFAHYLTLREINPAPFAAYMNLGAVKISSASPERFLTLRNGTAQTRPIKGTARRSADPAEDRARRSALLSSEKDRAENIMIVDLLRNDFSKICEAESVEATGICELESFAGVHHLVSTVKGKLRANKDAIDLLRACFPGGSITGAPKIRAMEIIEELEPVRRGPYCGAMGYIGFDGTMDTNILIRTLVYQGQKARLQAGGGITCESIPEAEYQETLDKAEAIFRSFQRRKSKTA